MGRKIGESRADRHSRAVAQTSRWAWAAANAGDYQDALSWLRVLETVEGRLPADLHELKRHCQSKVQLRASAHAVRREAVTAQLSRIA